MRNPRRVLIHSTWGNFFSLGIRWHLQDILGKMRHLILSLTDRILVRTSTDSSGTDFVTDMMLHRPVEITSNSCRSAKERNQVRRGFSDRLLCTHGRWYIEISEQMPTRSNGHSKNMKMARCAKSMRRRRDAVLNPFQGCNTHRYHPPLRAIHIHYQQQYGTNDDREQHHRGSSAL